MHLRSVWTATRSREGIFTTRFRIELLAIAWVIAQVALVTDVIYRVSHAQI